MDFYGMVFIVFVDYKDIIIGIFVYEWFIMVKGLIDLEVKSSDFCKLGYMFLFIVKDGGVFCCVGYMEVVVDLVIMCGFYLVGVICEVIKEDGMMVRLFDL